jgi:hypothetical protein
MFHSPKPDHIRELFYVSAQYEGVSLNDQLLQPPNLFNAVFETLFTPAKTKKLSSQKSNRCSTPFGLKKCTVTTSGFVWHKDSIMQNTRVTKLMRAHVFGNRPKPSIARYRLQHNEELSKDTHVQKL